MVWSSTACSSRRATIRVTGHHEVGPGLGRASSDETGPSPAHQSAFRGSARDWPSSSVIASAPCRCLTASTASGSPRALQEPRLPLQDRLLLPPRRHLHRLHPLVPRSRLVSSCCFLFTCIFFVATLSVSRTRHAWSLRLPLCSLCSLFLVNCFELSRGLAHVVLIVGFVVLRAAC